MSGVFRAVGRSVAHCGEGGKGWVGWPGRAMRAAAGWGGPAWGQDQAASAARLPSASLAPGIGCTRHRHQARNLVALCIATREFIAAPAPRWDICSKMMDVGLESALRYRQGCRWPPEVMGLPQRCGRPPHPFKPERRRLDRETIPFIPLRIIWGCTSGSCCELVIRCYCARAAAGSDTTAM